MTVAARKAERWDPVFSVRVPKHLARRVRVHAAFLGKPLGVVVAELFATVPKVSSRKTERRRRSS